MEEEKIEKVSLEEIREQIAEQKKRSKAVRRIKRQHKLYFRDSKRAIRNLDDVATNICDTILVYFFQGNGKKRYSMLNEKAKGVEDLKPIIMPIDKKFSEEFNFLRKVMKTSEESVIIYYNNSWRPLVQVKIDLNS